MGTLSAITHEFRRERNDDQEDSLYTALRCVNGTSETTTNQGLRVFVAENILARHDQCRTTKGYCEQIKKGKTHGGKEELHALARVLRLAIYTVPINQIERGNFSAKLETYNSEAVPFQECVFLTYDEETKHYDALYAVNKNDVNERTTIFFVGDPSTTELLEKFFLDQDRSTVKQALQTQETADDDLRMDTEQLDHLFVPSANPNVPLEDKSQKHVELALAPTVDPPADESQAARMRLEVDPALRFRGRTKGEFQPQKKQTRKGKPSEPRAPRYFPDRNNRRLFRLLIPEEKLASNTEYRVRIQIITPEIRGHSYINSYFRFQGDPKDERIEDLNSLDIPFQLEDLQQHSTGMKLLPIRFVLIKLKNPQLMQVEQPLKIFASNGNLPRITKRVAKHGQLKRTYRLQQLRLAVTLYKRKPGDTDFRPCDDAQYISGISTEDPTHTIN